MPKYNIPTPKELEAAQKEAKDLNTKLTLARDLFRQAAVGSPDRAYHETIVNHLSRQHRLASYKAEEMQADFTCFTRMRKSDRADMFETLLNELKVCFPFAEEIVDEATVERLRKAIATAEELL